MDKLKGTESLFMIVISLLSKIIDIPNYPELITASKNSSEDGSSDNSSLVKRNVFMDITTAAKNLFQSTNDSSEGEAEVIFGRPLPDLMPTKFKNLLRFLKRNIHLEGIFRINGSKKRIDDLKKMLDSHGNVIDWDEQDSFTVHDVASILKQYMSELPSPLLGDKHIAIHIEIAKLPDSEKKLKGVQLVCFLLPENHRLFLKALMMLLSEVAHNENNLMSSHNLGLIFAPHLLRSPEMDKAMNVTCLSNTTSDGLDDLVTYAAFLIDNSDKLFEAPIELTRAAERYRKRLDRGEMDIPVETNSSCHQVPVCLSRKVVEDETKVQLIKLYESMQQMPEGKERSSRLKKFEKTYPHYILELNSCSHSPIVRTKSSRKLGNVHSSLVRLLSVKHSSSTSSVSSEPTDISSVPPTQSTPTSLISQQTSVRRDISDTTPTTTRLPSHPNYSSTPNYHTPKQSEYVTNSNVRIGSKRKVLEMLQHSPTHATNFVPEAMETESLTDEPRAVRRKLEPESDTESEMEYREIGQTYREYFV